MLLTALVINLTGNDHKYNGFAVDKQERIYIGTSTRLLVVQDGKEIGQIDLAPIRGYTFTIERGEFIYVDTTSHLAIYNLNGSLRSRIPQSQKVVHTSKSQFTSINNVTYTCKNVLDCIVISKASVNGMEVVYRSSIWVWGYHLLFSACIFCAPFAVLFTRRCLRGKSFCA